MSDRDSDRNRSDIEPIEVIFRRIGQKQQIVPRSIERGTSYQAVHDPAPASARSPAAGGPSVVVSVTTAPRPNRNPLLIDPEPRRRRRAVITALGVALLIALASGKALVQLVFR